MSEITGLTGTSIHSGSWLGLPDLGITEKLQGTNSTSPQTDWGSLWNTAWNTGYNQANSSSNPYTGQAGGGYDIGHAYVLGQEAYKNDLAKSQSTGTKVTSTPQVLGATSSNDYQQAVDDQTARVRAEIEGGYSNYLNSLQGLLDNGLTQQYQNQNQIIQNNLQSNLGDLDTQKTLGMADLSSEEGRINTEQVKTLKDVSSNIRNLMQAGNTYLGSRGAGDSSAVNAYTYALTKLGSQQRGDVMSQTRSLLGEVNQRKFKLATTYDNERNKLNTEASSKYLEVSNWLAEQQNAIRQQIATGQLSKSQDLANLSTQLLNQAVAKLENYQNQISQKRSALEEWAVNNSKTIAEAVANLNQISDYYGGSVSYSPILGTPTVDSQGNILAQFRGGVGSSADDEDLFS